MLEISMQGGFQRTDLEEEFRRGIKRIKSEEESRGGLSMEILKRKLEEKV